jgi:hypothetical protein
LKDSIEIGAAEKRRLMNYVKEGSSHRNLKSGGLKTCVKSAQGMRAPLQVKNSSLTFLLKRKTSSFSSCLLSNA